ncbi:MAG: CpaF family protein [Acidobacteria bacterium]|nr:CpaF family protein [Acidobacteriota bacterium]
MSTHADPVAVGELHGLVLGKADILEASSDQRRSVIESLARRRRPLGDDATIAALVDAVFDRLDGLGELEPFLALDAVTDVMVTADGRVWIDDGAGLSATETRLDSLSVQRVLQRVVGYCHRRLDRSSPILDGHLPDGSRVHAVVEPVSVDGPVVSIRRFRTSIVGLEQCASRELVDTLVGLVNDRRNIIVTGATGAGKTTLLNALAARVATNERIITVEDAVELRLDHPHVVRLETRQATTDGLDPIDQRALLRAALRMRPDRVIVGEVRGPEAFDLVQAMLTGHEGSLATCHGRSAEDGLRRLESMVMMSGVGLPLEVVRAQIVAAVDYIVHVVRSPDGKRRVDQVVSVQLQAGEWSLESVGAP